jgi:hypothetical protein
LAIGFEEPILGNTWWSFKTTLTSEQQKALLLWLNCTPSLLMFLSRRVATRSAWMQVKQPAWTAMPVLDVRKLPNDVTKQLAYSYDALCTRELMALAKLDIDPVRAEIDQALSISLGLPDMKPLRLLLSREPGLTGKGLSPKAGQVALFADDSPKKNVPTQLRLL